MNALVAKAQKTPEEGWTMQDGTSWPGNNTRDHPGMIQVCYPKHFTLKGSAFKHVLQIYLEEFSSESFIIFAGFSWI